MLPSKLGKIFFYGSDHDGAVPGLLDHAVALAQPVLRAYATANLREGVRGLAELVRLAKASFRSEPKPVRNVVVERAMGLAIGNAALRAPAGLNGGLVRSVLAVDLAEILGARTWRSLVGRFAVDIHEREHFKFAHCEPSEFSFLRQSILPSGSED